MFKFKYAFVTCMVTGTIGVIGCAGSISGSSATQTRGPDICGATVPTAIELLKVQNDLDAVVTRGGGATKIQIPVYFHIITDGSGNGDVSDATLATQISVMNAAYAGTQSPGGANTAFRFTHASTDRTANAAWFNCARDSADEISMKTALHQGAADDLNIYVRDLSDGLMGYGGFPWNTATSPTDGVSIDYTGMPGGSNVQFNLGDLVVHEVGHWLGLFHTFEGGCTSANDYVSDTPAEDHYNWSCPAGPIDTCTGGQFKGADPTMNFMDYTTDSCKYQFTKGQDSRMGQCWTAYRAGK